MAISHFKITKLPSSDIIASIGADALEVDVLYPIDRESEVLFSRVPDLDGYYVNESFSYQVYEQDVDRYSNIAESIIQWKENDLATLLISSDLYMEMNNDESITLLNVIEINKAVEYIYIVEANGVNNTDNNGVPIVPGDKLSPSQLNKATFQTFKGGGSPYFEMKYKLGRGEELSETTYLLSVDMSSLADISIVSSESTNTQELDNNGFPVDYFSSVHNLRVQNAASLADVALEITSNQPWLNEENNNHFSEVSSSGQIYNPKTSPVTFQMIVKTDVNGELDIKVSSEIQVNTGSSYIGDISVRIVSVNGDSLLVSPTNDIVTAQINSTI